MADLILYNCTKNFGSNNREHMGLMYLASVLRSNNYKVKIFDALIEELESETVINELKNLDFKYLVMSFLSYGYEEAKKFSIEFKRNFPDKKLIIGGHFVSFCVEDVLKDGFKFDHAILGEGELALPKLIKDIELGKPCEKIIKIQQEENEYRDKVPKILPSRDFVNTIKSRNGAASISSSRGCYGKCSFCSVHNFYTKNNSNKWRARDPESVVSEIKMLNKKYGITKFDFIDDNFIGPGKKGQERAIRIAELIVEEGIKATFNFDLRVNDVNEELVGKWKKAGLKTVLIGMESISEEDLQLYNKKIKVGDIVKAIEILKQYEIKFTLGTLFWHPFTKLESLKKNIEFLNSIGYVEENLLTKLNVYKGTEFFNILSQQGLLKGEFYNYSWDFQDENIEHLYNQCFESIKISHAVINKYKLSLYDRNKIKKKNQDFLLEMIDAFINDNNGEAVVDKYLDSLLVYINLEDKKKLVV